MLTIPKELEAFRAKAQKAIWPIAPLTKDTNCEGSFSVFGQQDSLEKDLPPYYLIYFLLVEFLGFEDLGKGEKTAWTIPIDYKQNPFFVSYRKFGVRILGHPAIAGESQSQAKEIIKLIKKGVIAAEPFFEWKAEQAVKKSKLNVVNNSRDLFERYKYFLNEFKKFSDATTELTDSKKSGARESHQDQKGDCRFYYLDYRQKAKWYALAAIDAFFSWTEHIFVHIAILMGRVASGEQVAELAEADWQEKFKCVLDVSDPKVKPFYDELIQIRRQLRNYMAHGAFGKGWQAFKFHSEAGAIPVVLTHKSEGAKFSFAGLFGFEEIEAIRIIESFIEQLWADEREPARIYIQESDLPLILPKAIDGTYENAMQSLEAMNELVDRLSWHFYSAENMEW